LEAAVGFALYASVLSRWRVELKIGKLHRWDIDSDTVDVPGVYTVRRKCLRYGSLDLFFQFGELRIRHRHWDG
jgi:hypothetical protein